MDLKGKTVGILVEDYYQGLEVWYPVLRLQEEGINVVIIGTGRKKSYFSKHGLEIEQDMSAAEANANKLDSIVISGGYAPDILRRYESIAQLVKAIFDSGKSVAVTCHGLWVTISAGILKGKRVSSFSAIKDDVVNAGATYVDQEVVQDGNLITSRMQEDLPAFMKAIIQSLKTQKVTIS